MVCIFLVDALVLPGRSHLDTDKVQTAASAEMWRGVSCPKILGLHAGIFRIGFSRESMLALGIKQVLVAALQPFFMLLNSVIHSVISCFCLNSHPNNCSLLKGN